MYNAWLTFRDSFKDVYFPDQPSWNSQIVVRPDETGLDYDIYISVRALDNQLFIKPVDPLIWQDGSRRERHISDAEGKLFKMTNSKNGNSLAIMIRNIKPQWLGFTKYRMPNRSVTIGRSNKSDIWDSGVLVTAEHGVLSAGADGYGKYEDRSANGTYINGRKLLHKAVRLRFGDVIALPNGKKIVYLKDCIAVNHAAGKQGVHLEKWVPAREKPRAELELQDIPSVYMEYQRAPRMLMKSNVEDFEIEAPIAKKEEEQQPAFLQIGPSATMVLPMVVGTMVRSGSGAGAMMLGGVAMIGTSSALAVMWGIINRKYHKRHEIETEARRIEMYQRYIREVESKLSAMNQGEYQRLMDNFPNAAQCAQMPTQQSRTMWNRMPSHTDFLEMRLGTGDVAMPCEIVVPKQKLSIIDDELRDEPDRLKNDYSKISQAPITIRLREEAVIGILGGIHAQLFAQGFLVQIAALHSYHDVRIAVLTDEASASQWSWARWLPHVFASEDRELRMIGSNPADVHEIVAHLDEKLNIRRTNARERAQDNGDDAEKEEMPLPHYVIFCTDYHILESELIMRQLLTNRLGMTLVMIGSDMTHLPKECHYVLNVNERDGFVHASEGNTTKVVFEYPDRSLIRNFARAIAPMRVRDVTENGAIPTLVSFLDVYGVRRVDQLDVWRMWTENQTYDGIRSTIGYRAGALPFVLDISENQHGPHGLIAGTTGSGKSVMLETYILSLALNYSPKQIQFILIDYKGGGMADSFRDMPHVAGIIDNLQGERVISRALASLNGEIHRREVIFKKAQVKKIDEYNELYGGDPSQVMSHLIIIVDEFAELKSEQPEFMAELVSASRVGRSLGIHLILATQKPSNSVSDEIWANSRFHLCLRVQTRQDSMEMLKRADAAYIKGMGRCFIQIGQDELFEEVQTSYSGLDYKPDELRAEEIPQLLTFVGHTVRQNKSKNLKEIKLNQMKTLQEILERIKNGTWLSTEDNFIKISALTDEVERQRSMQDSIDLSQSGNLLMAGLHGAGKTTLMKGMVVSLCDLYAPEHLNIYTLNFFGETPDDLKALPQVTDVSTNGGDREIRRFIDTLSEEMKRRAELFAQASVGGFGEYNAAQLRTGGEILPAIVVFVDGYAQFREMFIDDNEYNEAIFRLIQEGGGLGVHFVVSAVTKKALEARLNACFVCITLSKELKDINQMDAVLDRIKIVAEEHQMNTTRQMWLPEMPRLISLREMEIFRRASWDNGVWPNPSGNIALLMGLADDIANQCYIPYWLDLTQSRNLLIAGLTGTGKTTLVQSMVYSLCSMYDPEHLNIYILSLSSQTLNSLRAFPQVADIAVDGEDLEIKRFINMLIEEMGRREEKFAQASTDSFVEYNASQMRKGEKIEPAIVVFIDRYAQLREMFANDDNYTALIQRLIQEGSGRGIHLVVTAMAKNEIQPRLHPFFTGIALQQKERSDYTEVLGKRVPYDMPSIATMAGRGMGVMNDTIYEVQFGVGGGAPEHVGEGFEKLSQAEKYIINHSLHVSEDDASTDVGRVESIISFARTQAQNWKGVLPREIPRIPKEPTWQIMSQDRSFREMQRTPFTIPVGYHMAEGSINGIDVSEAPGWLVHGPKGCGITNFLKLMARVMLDRGADVFVIADGEWKPLAEELKVPLYMTTTEILEFLNRFIGDYIKPRKPQFEAAREKGRVAQIEQAERFKPVCIIVDNAEMLYREFSRTDKPQDLQLVQGLFSELVEKPYYNFTVFMGVPVRSKSALAYDPLKHLAMQGRAIALGGKLNDWDPCNFANVLPMKARSAQYPAGQGFVSNNGAIWQVNVPKAD